MHIIKIGEFHSELTEIQKPGVKVAHQLNAGENTFISELNNQNPESFKIQKPGIKTVNQLADINEYLSEFPPKEDL